MIPSRFPHARKRLAAFSLIAAAGLALSIFSCSADDPNALGSESDLLGSEPGVVRQDTIAVFGDVVYAMNTPIAVEQQIELGMDSLYTRALILQPSFSGLTSQMKTAAVDSAQLRLPPAAEFSGSFDARFYSYGRTYAQGDAVDIRDLPDSLLLVDPKTDSTDRKIVYAKAIHFIDPAAVKRWTDVDSKRVNEAIVIRYTNPVDEQVAPFVAQESDEAGAVLQVWFHGIADFQNFRVTNDATVYLPRYTTTNLIVSDGYPRRVYFRVNRDALADNAAVHTARIRFHIVPNTLRGSNSTLLLYIPDDTLATASGFKTGQRITEQTITRASETVEFPLTNALFLINQGTLKDNGFAIRFKDENTLLRQVELYGTDAPDTLRPQVFVTTSTPAVFD